MHVPMMLALCSVLSLSSSSILTDRVDPSLESEITGWPAPPSASQDVEEGWITHNAATSPAAGITILGKMHAEKGTSWLIIRDLEKNLELERLRHSGPIRSMAFSRDGSRFVTCDSYSGLHVFESSTRKKLMDLKGHKGWIWIVALSPHGKLAASGGRDGTLRFWDVEKGTELWKKSFEKQVGKLIFTADGKGLIVSHHNGPLELWSLDGKVQATFTKKADSYWAMTLSPDGKFLATGHNDRWIKLWDVAEHKLLKKFQVSEGRIYSIAISPDSKKVACSTGEHAVHEFEIATSKKIRTIKLPKDQRNILALVYAKKQDLIGADYDGNTLFFDRKPKKTTTPAQTEKGTKEK